MKHETMPKNRREYIALSQPSECTGSRYEVVVRDGGLLFRLILADCMVLAALSFCFRFFVNRQQGCEVRVLSI